MNRITIYDTEQGRPFDFLTAEKMTLEGLGQLTQDVLGGVTAVATGLTATQTSPASLSINLAAGALYQAATVDPTPWGALPADTAIAFIQGVIQASPSLWLYNPSGAPSQGALTFSTAALTAGQSQYALVEAQFSFVDVVAPGDPSGGEVPYFNPANPAQPLIGPGGSGQTQPTMRLATAVFQIKYGTPATTGSEVPPTPDSGWVPLFLIDLAYGQTSIGTANILVAGPSVGLNVPSNYPAAPFLAAWVLARLRAKSICAGEGSMPSTDAGCNRSTIISLKAPLPQPTSSQCCPAGGASHSRKAAPASWLHTPIKRS